MAQRIMHITLRADYGGAPNYMNLMADYLSEDYELYVACPKDKPYYAKWDKNKNVKGIFVLPHRKFTIGHLFKLRQYIKENKINLIQANGKGAGVYGRLLKVLLPRLKVIFAYRGFHIQKYNWLQRMTYFFYEWVMQWLTDRVINVSNGERENIINHGVLKRRKSVTIYNGIPKTELSVNESLQEKYKRYFVVTTLSRFDYAKNMDSAYRIARKFKDEPNILFVWIGDGEDRGRLEKKCQMEELGNIHFVGFKNKSEIREFFSVSDLYLSTSRWEGLPFALIEAASIGLPIVATNVVGNNEVCIENVNGFLFENEDEESGKELILKLYSNRELMIRFRNGGISVFEENFTVERMVNQHEKLYESMF